MFIYSAKDIENIIDKNADRKNPSVSVSRGGKIYLCWQSRTGAFIVRSEDDGNSWSAPMAAVTLAEGETVLDNRLWVAPNGKLWFMWSVVPNNRVECVVCDDPDADTLVWSDTRTFDFGLLLSRPIVLSADGAWMLATGVTTEEINAREVKGGKEKGLYVYCSKDEGDTFTLISKPFGKSTFDAISTTEKVIYSRPNGVDIEGRSFFVIYAQVPYGIAKFVSTDGGVGFKAEADSAFGAYFSQFDISTIGEIAEKKFLLVNNMHFAEGGKMCLCALLSNNRGDNYQGVLELEAPENKVYKPDIALLDGAILVAYERETQNGKREIAVAKFTEQDVLAFELKDSASYLAKKVDF